jgi:hypothetical protein
VPDVPSEFDQLQIWAAQMIGIHLDDVTKRQTTANCLDALRKAGTIR